MREKPASPEEPVKADATIHSKLFTGSAFMLATRLLIKGIGLVSSVILARLLVAEDFGLVAIAMAFYAFIELFGAFGLQTVLIQKQSKDRNDYNTAWTFKVLFGLFTASVLFFASPYVASYYDDPRLELVVSIVGLVALIEGLVNIGVVEFQKNLDFRQELKFQLVPKVLSFIATISLAFYLRNYWALVCGMIIGNTWTLIFSYIVHPFRPNFSLSSSRELFGFSKWLLLQNFIFFMNNRVTDLLVGRMLSPTATGLFSIGNEFGSIATTEISAPINKASFPVYSMFAKKRADLKKAYLNTLTMCASVAVPASLGIIIVAPYFVPVILGPNWMEVIVLLQWVAASSLVTSLSTNNGYVFMACGKPQFSFYVGAFRMCIFLPALYLCVVEYGLVGAGIAMFAISLLIFVLTQVAICRFLEISFFGLCLSLLRPSSAAVFMYFCLYELEMMYLSLEAYQMLVILITAGGISYCLFQILMWILVGKPDGFEKNVFEKVINKFHSLNID